MTNRSGPRRAERRAVAVVAAIAMLMATGCTGQPPEELIETVLTTYVDVIRVAEDDGTGVRVNVHRMPLSRGVRIAPHSPMGLPMAGLECQGVCWLFLVDKHPMAHFAHPVTFILVDLSQDTPTTLDAQWWPEVDGRPVFHTVEERENPSAIVYESLPAPAPQPPTPQPILQTLATIQPWTVGPPVPCDAWAVVVVGYHDIKNTFDEDAEGMYRVLRGLGVPDDQIYFLTPHDHPLRDRITSIANVKWALKEVATNVPPTHDVLFFYSSEGEEDVLECVPYLPQPTAGGGTTWVNNPDGGGIQSTTLKAWLEPIVCRQMTIVIEACHSGSFIDRYTSRTYNAADDELTGNGETNRAVFTSASGDTQSWKDVDGLGDPNPGDVGSETIWGYIEAFASGAADADADGQISFEEGWKYSWKNDISRITGENTPQKEVTSLDPTDVFHSCPKGVGISNLSIGFGTSPGNTQSNTGPALPLEVVTGDAQAVTVFVQNAGGVPLANGKLELFWADSSGLQPNQKLDLHQIGSTVVFSALNSGATFSQQWIWEIDLSLPTGSHYLLVAVVDSPQDPFSDTIALSTAHDNVAFQTVTIVSGGTCGCLLIPQGCSCVG